MRLSYYCTSSWANYFLESLSGSTCFHFVMRPIVHVSWEEPLSIAAVVRKSIQKVLFNISIKKMCVYPHHCHTVPTAGLLICVVLLLWIFFQIQFHGDEDAGMTVVLGLVILQWYHSPSPGSHSINSFFLPYSFLAKALWSSTYMYFNAGGSLASRSSDKPAGLNSVFCSCVEVPSAF